MPEKDGDEGKSTKSVVNKKQKQMMGEEGYDIARDMGRVRPSKDKKDATTMPPSKEMKKTQKVNKGPSALDIVKKKYKGQIMKMEELDLTQVAEALGGHIVEVKKIGTVKPGEEEGTEAAIRKAAEEPKLSPAGRKRLTKISAKSKIGPDTVAKFKKALKDTKGADQAAQISKKRSEFAKSFVKPANVEIDPKKQSGIARDDVEKQGGRIGDTTTTDDGTTATALSGPVKVRKVDPRTLVTNPTGDPVSPKSEPKPRKPRTIPFKDRKQLDPETQKKVDAVTPAFATKQGETGPLPVSMRNRRVPKTSSLSPNVKVTSIVKPKVGALTQTDFNKIVPFRRGTKTYNDFINPEVVDPGGPKPERGGEIGKDTGRTVDTTVIKPDVLKLKPPKIAGYLAPGKTKADKPDPPEEPIADPIGGGKGGGKTKTKVGNFSYRPGGAFSKIRGFARRNPVLSLVGYDALKNFKVPSVTKPTKTGRVSAGQ